MRRCILLSACVLAAWLLARGNGVGAEEPKVPGPNVPGPNVPASLRTVAEASDFTQTAKSAEVVALVDRLCARSAALERFTFGTTVEMRDMVCVKVANPMVAGPEALANDDRPVILLLGNIHSGECCGKEALLMLLRDLALDPAHPWLKDVILLVAPNYNADGNDRFGPNAENRKGQMGPEQMGVRANAQGFDLNRDFVKLESPEGRSLVALMTAWNPALFIDCHTTNGSWHRYELTYDVPHNPAAPAAVRDLLRGRMLPEVARVMAKQAFKTFYYGNFSKDHTKWTTYGHEPRYSTEYVGLRGRLAILSEAYSYIPYKDRIRATKGFVEACVNWVRAHPAEVRKAVDARLTPAPTVPIGAKATAFEEKPRLLGYKEPSLPGAKGPSGHPRVRPKTEAVFEVEFLGNYVPAKTVKRPHAYVLAKELEGVVTLLGRHGITVERMTADARVHVEVSRIDSATKAAGTFQGHRLIRAVATSRIEERTLERGSYVVRTAQPLGTLAVYLLEAETDDGFVTWEIFGDALKIEADFPVLRVPDAATLPLERVAR